MDHFQSELTTTAPNLAVALIIGAVGVSVLVIIATLLLMVISGLSK